VKLKSLHDKRIAFLKVIETRRMEIIFTALNPYRILSGYFGKKESFLNIGF